MIPIGVAEAGAWDYAFVNEGFVYELLARWFPEIPAQAREIGRGGARRVVVQRYVDNVVAADRKMIGQVFHVFKWTPAELDRTISMLLQGGTIQEVDIQGLKHPQLLSARILKHAS